jgi:hypothetical protein
MLTPAERRLVYENAYLPEHILDYVEAVSGAEPHLQNHHLCFHRNRHLLFIGYPLIDRSASTPEAYESACKRFRPETVAIIAPEIWLPPNTFEDRADDCYFRLDLPLGSPNPEVAYMVRRAERELRVTPGKFNKQHSNLIKAFLSERDLSREQRDVYLAIPRYLARSKTAHLIEARQGDRLIAFSIFETGSAHYAFYLFTLRMKKNPVPGASDLLFLEMVRAAEQEGKTAVNLGLGINKGIRRFKEKWGGFSFLPCASALIIRREPFGVASLADKL